MRATDRFRKRPAIAAQEKVAQIIAGGLVEHALTYFSILSNIRFAFGGSRGMLRTSRCFPGILLKLGGPEALQAAERFVFLHLADFPFAGITGPPAQEFSGIARLRRLRASVVPLIFSAIGKSGPKLFATARRTKVFGAAMRSTGHNLRGKVAAFCVAVG